MTTAPPFPAGARRGLRRGMWSSDCDLAAARHADRAIAPGEATLSMEITDFMLNGHGLAHGGFVFALADSAFAFACNGYNQRTVAHQAAITYMAPGRLGERLTAVAREVYRAGPGRHLRRARHERPRRAGGGVPRPLAHRQGNPPAGVTGASNDIGRKRNHANRAHPPRGPRPHRERLARRDRRACSSSG